MKHIAHEHISDYEEAVNYIVKSGYKIDGIVIYGLQKLFTVLANYNIQMCQFHMVAIVRRKLTKILSCLLAVSYWILSIK